MTVQNLYELAQLDAPELGFTEFLKRLNRVQREFAIKTRCFWTVKTVVLDKTKSYWDVTADVYAISEVLGFFDSDGTIIREPAIAYTLDSRVMNFYDLDTNELTTATWPSIIHSMKLLIFYVPVALEVAADICLLEEAFQDALVSRILEEVAVRKGNALMAKYHRGIYEDRVRDAKRYSNIGGDATGWKVRTDDH